MNSKILGVLIALLATVMVISAASAVDLADDFKNDDFKIATPSGCDFTDSVNISADGMKMVIFQNIGKSTSDVNSIIYFMDSSANKKEIDQFIKDMEDGSNKVEETDKYVVLENSNNFTDVDIGEGIDSALGFADNIFSSEGINLSADGNSLSLSSDGLKVSDESGEKVSITSEGISVSGDDSSANASVNVSSDIDSSIKDTKYSLYLKNNSSDRTVVISGDNLELLKSMAETVTFNEN